MYILLISFGFFVSLDFFLIGTLFKKKLYTNLENAAFLS